MGRSARTKAISFAGADALVAALRAGLVPSEIASAPVEELTETDPSEIVLTSPGLPRAVRDALVKSGAREVEAGGARASHASWLLAVPPRPTPHAAPPGERLFFVPRQEDLLELASSLVRLGCADFELAIGEAGAYARVRRPPYYLELRALEPGHPARVLRRADDSRRGPWIELGLAHPLADAVSVPEGTLVLVLADGTRIDRAVSFVPALDHAELALPPLERPEALARSAATASKVRIEPRLARAVRPREPSVWALDGPGFDAIDRWVAESGEAALEGFEVALLSTPEGEIRAVVRARAMSGGSPSVAARGYAAIEGAPSLFVPAGRRVHPPLSAARLMRALDMSECDGVVMLDEAEGRGLVARAIPTDAFRPLDEWVEIHLERAGDALVPWIRSVAFDLRQVRARPRASSETGPEPLHAPEPHARPRRRQTGPRRDAAVRDAPVGERIAAVRAVPTSIEMARVPERRTALESELLASSASLAAAARAPLLFELAVVLDAAQEHDEALRCRAWAVAGAADDERPEVARAALGAIDADGCVAQLDAAASLEKDAPGRAALLLVGALGASTPLASARRAALADAVCAPTSTLPAPLVWDAACALSTMAGQDALLLSRVDDALRFRLARGLAPGLDVPLFVRRADLVRASGFLREPAQAAAVLDSLLEVIEPLERHRNHWEAPWPATLRNVHWLFAIGQARLGAARRAEELATRAAAGPRPTEVAIDELFRVRFGDAIAQHGSLRPLPSALLARLDRLGRFPRYVVDHTMEALTLLGGGNARDPFGSFGGAIDPRGELVSALESARDAGELAERFDRATIEAEGDAKQAVALAWAVRLLPPSLARPRIRRLAELARGLDDADVLAVLAELAASAATEGATDALDALATQIGDELLRMPADEALVALVDGRRILPALALAGRADDACRLAGEALERAGDESPLSAALEVGAFLRSLGRPAPGLTERTQLAVRQYIRQKDSARRLRLVPSLVRALCAGENEEVSLHGLGIVARSAAEVTDTYQTSRHFSLSVLTLVDGLVSAFTSEAGGVGSRTAEILAASESDLRARVRAAMRDEGETR